jgi:hypothetical protein
VTPALASTEGSLASDDGNDDQADHPDTIGRRPA